MSTKVFIGNVSTQMTSDDLVHMFEPHGEIVECDIVKNYAFLCSLGSTGAIYKFNFKHYKEPASAERAAAALNGTKFLENTLRVEVSKSRLHQAPGGGRGGGRSTGGSTEKTKKLFVGNLPQTAKSADLKKIFDTYGHVTECAIVRDFAFVHFEHEDEAELAADMLNGTEFAGGSLSVEKSHTKQKVGGNSGDGCYNCGKPGHISRECRSGMGGGRGGGGMGGGHMMRGGGGYGHTHAHAHAYPRAPMFDSYDDLEDYYAFRAHKHGLPIDHFRERLPPMSSRYRDYVDPYPDIQMSRPARSYHDPYDRPAPYYYDSTAARRRPAETAGPAGDYSDRYRFAIRSRDEMPRRRAPLPY